MLTALDDTLMHQSAELFVHASVSDHRFFDRTVLGVHAPDGGLNLATSFGVYKNNNVMDGFAMLSDGSGRQFNHRFSRKLELDYDHLTLGPLSVEVLEPLKRARIRLAPGNYPASYDIEWTAVLPPYLEQRHLVRHGGRTVRDHLRFDQFARATGWIELDGKRTEFKDWFAWRDHSWGVRPGVGGFEPYSGGLEHDDGYLGIYIWWLTDNEGGLLQFQENGDGKRMYLDGVIQSRKDGSVRRIVDASHDIVFLPGTRTFDVANLAVVAEDGSRWDIEARSHGRPWVFRGGGYDHGYNDGKSLGFWRGEWLEEYDVYDVTHPEDVVMPDGSLLRPLHREQFSTVTVNGRPGQAYTPVISTGPHRRYGFAGGAGVMPG